MSCKATKVTVKRGDDFRLTMTAQDKNNPTSRALKVIMDAAMIDYENAKEAVPQVAQDILDTYAALEAAQIDYYDSIIMDISTWTITAKMAWCGRLISTFDVEITDGPNGVFVIGLDSADTTLWKPRSYDADVQFVRTEGKISSETFTIIVEKDITSD